MAYVSLRNFREVIGKHTVIRFIVVGSLGFVVNFAFLYLLHGRMGVNVLVSQLIAAELALLSNFFFHNKWTYRGYVNRSLFSRILLFHASSWSGVFITTTLLMIFVSYFNIFYLTSLVLAGILAGAWNYSWSRYYVWKKEHSIVTNY